MNTIRDLEGFPVTERKTGRTGKVEVEFVTNALLAVRYDDDGSLVGYMALYLFQEEWKPKK